jgi:hypothetical protein
MIRKLADLDVEANEQPSVQCATPRCSVCGAVTHQEECFERSSFVLWNYFAYKLSKELLY